MELGGGPGGKLEGCKSLDGILSYLLFKGGMTYLVMLTLWGSGRTRPMEGIEAAEIGGGAATVVEMPETRVRTRQIASRFFILFS